MAIEVEAFGNTCLPYAGKVHAVWAWQAMMIGLKLHLLFLRPLKIPQNAAAALLFAIAQATAAFFQYLASMNRCARCVTECLAYARKCL